MINRLNVDRFYQPVFPVTGDLKTDLMRTLKAVIGRAATPQLRAEIDSVVRRYMTCYVTACNVCQRPAVGFRMEWFHERIWVATRCEEHKLLVIGEI